MQCGSGVGIFESHGPRGRGDQPKFFPAVSEPELLLKIEQFICFYFPIPVHNTQEIFQSQKINRLNKPMQYNLATESVVK
jgi:hypothetical protein